MSDRHLLWPIVGGIVGAYVSLIRKASKGEGDAAAGFGLHFVEVFTKLIIGSVFGVLAIVVAKSANAPAALKVASSDTASAFVVAFAAGLLEGLVPRMISQYSGVVRTPNENE